MRTNGRRTNGRLAAMAASVAVLVLGSPSIASASPPSNDAFESRTIVPAIPFAETLSTDDASWQPGEPDAICRWGISKTVWYEYTPSADGVVSVDTFGSNFDTIVAVWTGEDLENLSRVACSDSQKLEDGHWYGTGNAFFRATAGTPYLIQIGGYWDSSGDLSVNIVPSTAGSISGTVTSSGGGPVDRVCVEVSNAETDSYAASTWTTADGSYFAGGLPDGAYTLWFNDCWDYQHEAEWYNDVKDWQEADRVMVSNAAAVTGVDAELALFSPTLSVYVYGAGTVTSQPAGIDCGTDCDETFPPDSTVTLTATPDPQSRFATWYGCDRHEANVCQVDMQGSRYVYAEFTEVDTDAPDTRIESGPAEYTSSRSAIFGFSSNDWATEFECSLDGGVFAHCYSWAEFSDLADGRHQLAVRAVDRSGNVDPSPAEWSWTVDTTKPVIRFDRPTQGLYVNNQSVGGAGPTVVVAPVTVEVHATDAESGISSFGFYVNDFEIHPSRVTVDGNVYRFTFRPSTVGTYEIGAQATNRAGGAGWTAIEVIGAPGP